jgi:BlaI family penicillinase repressor
MPRMVGTGLSRREREILDILHRLGQATVAEVRDLLPEPPSYSAVRSILRILGEKGHVRFREDGKRYLYSPVEAPQSAARSALQQVVQNFFGGSLEHAVKAFLTDGDADVSAEELERLSKMIEQARSEESAR